MHFPQFKPFERVRIAQDTFGQGQVRRSLSTGDAARHGAEPVAAREQTLILSYRAADAYPVYLGETRVHAESHVLLVRGELLSRALFGTAAMPIPRYQGVPKSLYDLQKRFRQQRS